MQLMTQALEQRFATVGSQEQISDPLILAHFFNPTGGGDWYATEYDPDSWIFFGYVCLYGDGHDEWGAFSLEELATYTGRFGLGIERDLYWQEQPASQVIAGFTGWGS